MKKYDYFLRSVWAGVFITMAGVCSVAGSVHIENFSIAKILSALIFTGGIICCFLSNGILFTGSMSQIKQVLEKKMSVGNMLINWLIILFGNAVGSFITALAVNRFFTDILTLEKLSIITENKISNNMFTIFISAIICNILVCLAVWDYSVRGRKNVIAVVPVFLFIILGAEHVVANFGYFSFYILNNSTTINVSGLLTTTILAAFGNITGGLLISITGYYTDEKNK